MNFQGPRDLTPNVKQYQRVVAYLLYVEDSYPEIFEMLRQAPQFEYEIEVCRYKRHRARKYLLMLKDLVKKYERENHPLVSELKLQKGHVTALVDVTRTERFTLP